jgi:hypothetical protein
VLSGQLGVGDGEKHFLDFGLGGEVRVAEDGGGMRGGVLRAKRAGNKRQKKQRGIRLAQRHKRGLFE